MQNVAGLIAVQKTMQCNNMGALGGDANSTVRFSCAPYKIHKIGLGVIGFVEKRFMASLCYFSVSHAADHYALGSSFST